MLIKIVLAVTVVIIGILGYAGFQSPDYQVRREIEISAAPDVIFPHLNHSQKMNDWMPWKESDPGVQMEYSGPVEGVGSKSSWASEGPMGTGNAEIVESVPNETVVTKLEYTKPMTMSQMAKFTLAPAPSGGTIVTWSVAGQNSFIGRVVCLFMNMDKMVGTQFEAGLEKLKATVLASKT